MLKDTLKKHLTVDCSAVDALPLEPLARDGKLRLKSKP